MTKFLYRLFCTKIGFGNTEHQQELVQCYVPKGNASWGYFSKFGSQMILSTIHHSNKETRSEEDELQQLR